MKKYIPLLAIALLLSSNTAALAETGTSATIKLDGGTTTRPLTPEQKARMEEEKKAMMEKRAGMKAEFKGEMEVKKGEWKDEVKGKVGDIRVNARGMVATNLMRRADNLAQISSRIKTRLEKIKSEDKIDTAATLALVIKADASIAVAKTHAAEVKASVEANESLETIKHHAEESRIALKEAHGYLGQAIKDLKGRMVSAGLNAEVKAKVDVKSNTQ